MKKKRENRNTKREKHVLIRSEGEKSRKRVTKEKKTTKKSEE